MKNIFNQAAASVTMAVAMTCAGHASASETMQLPVETLHPMVKLRGEGGELVCWLDDKGGRMSLYNGDETRWTVDQAEGTILVHKKNSDVELEYVMSVNPATDDVLVRTQALTPHAEELLQIPNFQKAIVGEVGQYLGTCHNLVLQVKQNIAPEQLPPPAP